MHEGGGKLSASPQTLRLTPPLLVIGTDVPMLSQSFVPPLCPDPLCLEENEMTQITQDVDPWLDLAEQAAYAKHCKSFMSREIRAGRLRAVAPGTGTVRRRWLARRSWVDKWLENASTSEAAAGEGKD